MKLGSTIKWSWSKSKAAYLLAFVCLVFSYTQVRAQDSPQIRSISILTCTPGPDLYSLFGHSAIRVQALVNERPIDWVYNYGAFQFDDDFYYRFALGRLDYILSKSDFGDFQYEYIQTGRGIFEQQLLLNESELNELWKLLEQNYLPENRTYRYHFFYDNCSTRIRDIIQKATSREVIFTHVGSAKPTFRDAIQNYLEYQPWSDFGIDLALGLPCDKEMVAGDDMFLPDSLMNQFHFATLGGGALVSRAQEILPAEYELTPPGMFTPLNLFSLLLILHILIGVYFWRKGRTVQLTDRLFLLITGLLGALIVFLWFFTDHTTTKWNLNLLWANPINLILALLLHKNSISWIKRWINVYFILLAFTVTGWFFIPQDFNPAILPIMFALMFTLLKIIYPNLISAKSN